MYDSCSFISYWKTRSPVALKTQNNVLAMYITEVRVRND